MDTLPDSRLSNPRGLILGSGPLGNWVPIFCASCGKPGGACPAENMHFICWLCHDCAAKYGEAASMMMMPDEVFWARVKEAQLETYGRQLAAPELAAVVAEDASPLATLLKEAPVPKE
jgi:hypothetical protein